MVRSGWSFSQRTVVITPLGRDSTAFSIESFCTYPSAKHTDAEAFHPLMAVIAVVVLLALIAIYTITQTEWGRGQVHKRVLAMLQNNAHGIVRMGPVTGNPAQGLYGP